MPVEVRPAQRGQLAASGARERRNEEQGCEGRFDRRGRLDNASHLVGMWRVDLDRVQRRPSGLARNVVVDELPTLGLVQRDADESVYASHRGWTIPLRGEPRSRSRAVSLASFNLPNSGRNTFSAMRRYS